jgi:hypothetical protein
MHRVIGGTGINNTARVPEAQMSTSLTATPTVTKAMNQGLGISLRAFSLGITNLFFNITVVRKMKADE